MNELKIELIASTYGSLLRHEYEAKTRLMLLEASVLEIAYDEGQINGKNAEARKLQANVALFDNLDYTALLQELSDVEANRKEKEAEIGLLKAFMYSQSGV